MKNRRERKATTAMNYARASWYAGQHYYRLGRRAMQSRTAIDFRR